jgi:hypothetical protein
MKKKSTQGLLRSLKTQTDYVAAKENKNVGAK